MQCSGNWPTTAAPRRRSKAVILLDDRAGSKDFAPLLPKTTALVRLPYGDAAFFGNGAEGKAVYIGVELKQISDVLNSMTTGRFAGHQLPGMLEEYDFSYLCVFGAYRADPKTGILQTPRRRGWGDLRLGSRTFMWRDLESWLITMETKTPLKVRKCRDKREAAHFIKTLCAWWNEKEYEKHRAHLVMYDTAPVAGFIKPSLLRRIASQLPGVGYERSKAVADHFGSVKKMMRAKERDWMKVEGVGKGIAKKVVEVLQR